MQRQAENPYEEALGKGMAFSQSYPIAGRGMVHVATDKAREDFASDEAYVRYIYDNRHDKGKVRFINVDKDYLYRSGSEQDRLAKEIARQEKVEITPPFRRGAEEEQRTVETRSFSVPYAGSQVRISMDVSGMSPQEREWLQADIDGIRYRPRSEAFAVFENDFSKFLDKYLDRMTEIKVKGVSVRLDEATISDIDQLARRS